MRIAIVGGPRTGKTHAARAVALATDGQRVIASGIDTVLDEILGELQALGVVVVQEPVT